MKISNISYVSKYKKSHRKKRVPRYFSILLILSFVCVFLISAIQGWKLSRPTKVIPQKFDVKEFPTMSEISFKDSQNKLNLSGTFFKATNPDNCIILSHSYGKNRMLFDSTTPSFVKSCLDKNFNVLSFDYRNSGNSEGTFSSFGYYEKYDLLGAIKYIKSTGAKNISVIGLSTGASVALITAAEDPGIVNSIIADSSFLDLKQYLYNNLHSWNKLPSLPFTMLTLPTFSAFTGVDVSNVSPFNALLRIPAEKVMLIQSEDDLEVSYKDALKLFEQSDSASVFWVIKKATHGKIYETYPKEYIERIFSFIQKRIPVNATTNNGSAPQNVPPANENTTHPAFIVATSPDVLPSRTPEAVVNPTSTPEIKNLEMPNKTPESSEVNPEKNTVPNTVNGSFGEPTSKPVSEPTSKPVSETPTTNSDTIEKTQNETTSGEPNSSKSPENETTPAKTTANQVSQ